MLADQLLEMSEPFLITRSVATEGGERTVYFLSPTMPAKEVRVAPDASHDEVRQQLVSVVAERGRWRYRVGHRRAGDFDIFVAASRVPYLAATLGLGVVALVLLPAAAVLAQRATRRTVLAALVPFARTVAETQQIDPRDLSERVTSPTGLEEVTELANEINRLVSRVERANAALEAFTADASHELRTPLTHLRAQAQWALAEHRSVEEMREALGEIAREVDQTTKMIEDLLLIARGENQQLAVAVRLFDLAEVAQDVEEITEAMAAGRDVAVRAVLDGPAPALGDADRTRQILLNLASNAVRYTARGSITFELLRSDGMVGVAVSDTGVGIGAEDLQRVFERFQRAEESRSRAHGGAGLGLTIARMLAELQAGTISVESTPNEGSRFVLWLPAGD
jgi:signal transduction histidine kinase